MSEIKALSTEELTTMLSDPSITDYDLLDEIASELVKRERATEDAKSELTYEQVEKRLADRPLSWM